MFVCARLLSVPSTSMYGSAVCVYVCAAVCPQHQYVRVSGVCLCALLSVPSTSMYGSAVCVHVCAAVCPQHQYVRVSGVCLCLRCCLSPAPVCTGQRCVSMSALLSVPSTSMYGSAVCVYVCPAVCPQHQYVRVSGVCLCALLSVPSTSMYGSAVCVYVCAAVCPQHQYVRVSGVCLCALLSVPSTSMYGSAVCVYVCPAVCPQHQYVRVRVSGVCLCLCCSLSPAPVCTGQRCVSMSALLSVPSTSMYGSAVCVYVCAAVCPQHQYVRVSGVCLCLPCCLSPAPVCTGQRCVSMSVLLSVPSTSMYGSAVCVYVCPAVCPQHQYVRVSGVCPCLCCCLSPAPVCTGQQCVSMSALLSVPSTSMYGSAVCVYVCAAVCPQHQYVRVSGVCLCLRCCLSPAPVCTGQRCVSAVCVYVCAAVCPQHQYVRVSGVCLCLCCCLSPAPVCTGQRCVSMSVLLSVPSTSMYGSAVCVYVCAAVCPQHQYVRVSGVCLCLRCCLSPAPVCTGQRCVSMSALLSVPSTSMYGSAVCVYVCAAVCPQHQYVRVSGVCPCLRCCLSPAPVCTGQRCVSMSALLSVPSTSMYGSAACVYVCAAVCPQHQYVRVSSVCLCLRCCLSPAPVCTGQRCVSMSVLLSVPSTSMYGSAVCVYVCAAVCPQHQYVRVSSVCLCLRCCLSPAPVCTGQQCVSMSVLLSVPSTSMYGSAVCVYVCAAVCPQHQYVRVSGVCLCLRCCLSPAPVCTGQRCVSMSVLLSVPSTSMYGSAVCVYVCAAVCPQHQYVRVSGVCPCLRCCLSPAPVCTGQRCVSMSVLLSVPSTSMYGSAVCVYVCAAVCPQHQYVRVSGVCLCLRCCLSPAPVCTGQRCVSMSALLSVPSTSMYGSAVCVYVCAAVCPQHQYVRVSGVCLCLCCCLSPAPVCTGQRCVSMSALLSVPSTSMYGSAVCVHVCAAVCPQHQYVRVSGVCLCLCCCLSPAPVCTGQRCVSMSVLLSVPSTSMYGSAVCVYVCAAVCPQHQYVRVSGVCLCALLSVPSTSMYGSAVCVHVCAAVCPQHQYVRVSGVCLCLCCCLSPAPVCTGQRCVSMSALLSVPSTSMYGSAVCVYVCAALCPQHQYVRVSGVCLCLRCCLSPAPVCTGQRCVSMSVLLSVPSTSMYGSAVCVYVCAAVCPQHQYVRVSGVSMSALLSVPSTSMYGSAVCVYVCAAVCPQHQYVRVSGVCLCLCCCLSPAPVCTGQRCVSMSVLLSVPSTSMYGSAACVYVCAAVCPQHQYVRVSGVCPCLRCCLSPAPVCTGQQCVSMSVLLSVPSTSMYGSAVCVYVCAAVCPQHQYVRVSGVCLCLCCCLSPAPVCTGQQCVSMSALLSVPSTSMYGSAVCVYVCAAVCPQHQYVRVSGVCLCLPCCLSPAPVCTGQRCVSMSALLSVPSTSMYGSAVCVYVCAAVCPQHQYVRVSGVCLCLPCCLSPAPVCTGQRCVSMSALLSVPSTSMYGSAVCVYVCAAVCPQHQYVRVSGVCLCLCCCLSPAPVCTGQRCVSMSALLSVPSTSMYGSAVCVYVCAAVCPQHQYVRVSSVCLCLCCCLSPAPVCTGQRCVYVCPAVCPQHQYVRVSGVCLCVLLSVPSTSMYGSAVCVYVCAAVCPQHQYVRVSGVCLCLCCCLSPAPVCTGQRCVSMSVLLSVPSTSMYGSAVCVYVCAAVCPQHQYVRVSGVCLCLRCCLSPAPVCTGQRCVSMSVLLSVPSTSMYGSAVCVYVCAAVCPQHQYVRVSGVSMSALLSVPSTSMYGSAVCVHVCAAVCPQHQYVRVSGVCLCLCCCLSPAPVCTGQRCVSMSVLLSVPSTSMYGSAVCVYVCAAVCPQHQYVRVSGVCLCLRCCLSPAPVCTGQRCVSMSALLSVPSTSMYGSAVCVCPQHQYVRVSGVCPCLRCCLSPAPVCTGQRCVSMSALLSVPSTSMYGSAVCVYVCAAVCPQHQYVRVSSVCLCLRCCLSPAPVCTGQRCVSMSVLLSVPSTSMYGSAVCVYVCAAVCPQHQYVRVSGVCLCLRCCLSPAPVCTGQQCVSMSVLLSVLCTGRRCVSMSALLSVPSTSMYGSAVCCAAVCPQHQYVRVSGVCLCLRCCLSPAPVCTGQRCVSMSVLLSVPSTSVCCCLSPAPVCTGQRCVSMSALPAPGQQCVRCCLSPAPVCTGQRCVSMVLLSVPSTSVSMSALLSVPSTSMYGSAVCVYVCAAVCPQHQYVRVSGVCLCSGCCLSPAPVCTGQRCLCLRCCLSPAPVCTGQRCVSMSALLSVPCLSPAPVCTGSGVCLYCPQHQYVQVCVYVCAAVCPQHQYVRVGGVCLCVCPQHQYVCRCMSALLSVPSTSMYGSAPVCSVCPCLRCCLSPAPVCTGQRYVSMSALLSVPGQRCVSMSALLSVPSTSMYGSAVCVCPHVCAAVCPQHQYVRVSGVCLCLLLSVPSTSCCLSPAPVRVGGVCLRCCLSPAPVCTGQRCVYGSAVCVYVCAAVCPQHQYVRVSGVCLCLRCCLSPAPVCSGVCLCLCCCRAPVSGQRCVSMSAAAVCPQHQYVRVSGVCLCLRCCLSPAVCPQHQYVRVTSTSMYGSAVCVYVCAVCVCPQHQYVRVSGVCLCLRCCLSPAPVCTGQRCVSMSALLSVSQHQYVRVCLCLRCCLSVCVYVCAAVCPQHQYVRVSSVCLCVLLSVPSTSMYGSAVCVYVCAAVCPQHQYVRVSGVCLCLCCCLSPAPVCTGQRCVSMSVLLSVPSTSMYGSAVCAYNMSALERAFSGPYKYQESVQMAWNKVPNAVPNLQVTPLPPPRHAA